MSHVQNPKQKLLKESDENTNQHNINDNHKVMKLADEEYVQMDTRLIKYGQNSE
jgi:hypothetical protein